MKTIFVIEQGSYSDYRVVGVFSSRANAELAFKALYGEEYDAARTMYQRGGIEEWPFDPMIEELNAGLTQFSVDMLRSGNSVSAPQRQSADLTVLAPRVVGAYGEVRNGTLVEQRLMGRVWARDEDHAVKIANEIRTQLIASGEWKEPPVVVSYADPPKDDATGAA